MAHNEKTVSEEFPELFHYTNLSAFRNIYETRKLWATHYHDLNDATEFTRFRGKVRKFIYPMIRDIFDKEMQRNAEFAAGVNTYGGIDSAVDKEAEDLLDTVHRHTFGKEMYKETFICSFCAHTLPYEATHGLLSQWRGYGTDGGIAIVFNTSAIKQMMYDDYDHISQLQLMFLDTVEYDSDDNESDMRIKRRFKTVFEFFPEIVKRWYSDNEPYDKKELEPLFEKIHDDFVLGSTLVKHHAFHEENEIRIVVSPKTENSYNCYNPGDTRQKREILYRPVSHHEARYIELFGNAPLPIKRIIIGPSRIQNVNCQAIKAIIKSSSIDVVKSEIPFIG